MFSPASCQTGQTVQAHAISADGTKAFWTYQAVPPNGPSQLLARINGSETVQLDKRQIGGGNPATAPSGRRAKDGSVVYFTSPNRLLTGTPKRNPAPPTSTAMNSPNHRQNRCGTVTKRKAPRRATSRAWSAPATTAPYVYFVAGAALTAEKKSTKPARKPKRARTTSTSMTRRGRDHFIARLSSHEDRRLGSPSRRRHSARVSPDGQHLAFLSVEASAGRL